MTNMLKIRRALKSDSEFLWNLRNDPTARVNFVSQEEVSWANHSVWFDTAIVSEAYRIYVGENQQGELIGVCRFESKDNFLEAEVSITIHSAYRGKGCCRSLLVAAVDALWVNAPCKVLAKVKLLNAQSSRCFEASGFKLVNKDKEFCYFSLEPKSMYSPKS